MTISKKDNWKGASPALIDAITHINILLKERGVNAECDNIYIQYRRFDGFVINIIGEKLDAETVRQCQLLFINGNIDVNEYPHDYLYGEPMTTQLFIEENEVFYVISEDDSKEDYFNAYKESVKANYGEGT